MSLMLDTQAALWWLTDGKRLSQHARDAIAASNGVFVSALSVMEVAIGRVRDVIPPPAEFVADLEASGFRLLAFDAADALALERLPRLHGDPFDRALAAQAQRRNLTLMTSDRTLEQYPIAVYRI